MPALARARALQKPPQNAEIDWQNPLTAQLGAAVLFHPIGPQTRDHVRNRVSAWTTTGGTPTYTPDGVLGAAAGTWILGSFDISPVKPSGMTGFSAFAWIRISGSTHGVAVAIDNPTSGISIGVGNTQFDNNGTNVIGASNNVAWIPTTNALTTGVWHLIGFTWDANVGGTKLWLDGYECNNAAHNNPGINTATPTNFRVGVGPGILSGDHRAAYGWTRRLHPNEILELYNDPYGMFAPPTPRLLSISFVPAPATGATASGGAASGGNATANVTALASGGAASSGSGFAQSVCSANGGAASGGSGQATCSLQGVASGGAASGGSAIASGGSTAAAPESVQYSRPTLPAYPVRHRYRHRLELRTYAESHAITLLRQQTRRACKRTQNPVGTAIRHQWLPESLRCEARGRITVRDTLAVDSLHRYRHLEWPEMLRMLRIQESQVNELIDHL